MPFLSEFVRSLSFSYILTQCQRLLQFLLQDQISPIQLCFFSFLCRLFCFFTRFGINFAEQNIIRITLESQIILINYNYKKIKHKKSKEKGRNLFIKKRRGEEHSLITVRLLAANFHITIITCDRCVSIIIIIITVFIIIIIIFIVI